MPLGIVLLDWDRVYGPVLKEKYLEDQSAKVDEELVFTVFMAHSSTGKDKEEHVQLVLQFKGVTRNYLRIAARETKRRARQG